METFLFNKPKPGEGFSLLEVLIAITVLAVGLCSLGALVAQTVTGTERARYIGLATTLASEKLEDLNKWPVAASQVADGGSLTSDATAGGLSYYDDVDLSNTSGQVSETVTTGSGGTAVYSGIVHLATGEVRSSTTAPPSGSGVVAFHRRWLIEATAPPTVNGVTLTGSRRVTVNVSLTNLAVKPAVSFQMSVIRP